MSRVLIGNLPPGTTIRNIDDFCSPFGRLLYVDVKTQGNATLACVEYENTRNANNLVRARHGYNFNGYTVQLKIMTEGSGSGGLFEVRDESRRRNAPSAAPPAYSRSQSNFESNNRGNYYNNNSNSNGGTNNLDFTEACRIVYDRFISEGFNAKVAREKALEFVNNMQGRNNQGFDGNSDYFDQSQRSNSNYFGGQSQSMNSNSYDNYNGGNQNWGRYGGGGGSGSGGNWDTQQNWGGGNQGSFPNSNWGNFNGPNNQQMPPSWGGAGVGGGSRWDGWNNRGSNFYPNSGRMGGGGGGARANVVDQDTYLKSVAIRKKIEAKITKGVSTPRDLRNLQFHTQIMDDYERNLRSQKKVVTSNNDSDELQKLQRYKSALGIVHKFKKVNKSTLSPEDLKSYNRNKVIVDEYESYVASKAKGGRGGGKASTPAIAFERKKQQLIKEAKKIYGTDFRLSGAAKKKMRSLLAVGFDMDDARLLALHSSLVCKELIELKNAAGIKGAVSSSGDKSKALVPVGGAKPAQKKDEPHDPALGRLKDMTKKERAGMRSANRLIAKYEAQNTEIESLTERDIILLRIALKRLKVYNEKFETPLPKTKYEELLSAKYDKKEPAEGEVKKEEAMEQGNEGEAAAEENGDAEAGEAAADDQTAADE
ncbi:uncharacterized protein LOC106081019 [Stomoxys calcitrans]|uniref:uncharacterized protein LOC106081019 n=1 Tax=Stomoxys calcitrans TaxID=35570 RepID=UPI0027E2EA8F|nr:uncharacterized protein LOC106081019 [Stomoxys calcitrans]